ncbi:MAG TPA: lipoyl(octanoyl) transferase LipB [Anaerolineaceae bacterium]|nr:lipoyl(octanoyl) transferase LipB [Anaerolineaceae bacterium]
MEKALCATEWFGCVPYAEAWKMQRDMAQEIATGNRLPTLMLLEHPHTFTIGRGGGAQNILWDATELSAREVEVFAVDRGGDVTYHGPGQLIGYPLIPLAKPGWQGERLPQADYVGFVRKLEVAIILTLAQIGIVSGQRQGLTGVWVAADVWARCPRCIPSLTPQPAKIASIGVKVDARGISQHGFALNVDPDMRYWEGIIPCGLEGVSMCSVADFITPVPTLKDIATLFADSFASVFNFQIQPSNLTSGG